MKGPFFIFLLLMPAFVFLIFLILLAMQYKQLKALVSPQRAEMPAVQSSPESQARVVARLDSFLLAPRAVPAGRTAADSSPAAPTATSATSATPSAGAVQGNANDTLSLSAADLNDLIRGSESLEKLGLDYHLTTEETLLVAKNSLPVEHLQGLLAGLARLFRVRGYLNSEMRGYPKLEGGKLYLVPISAIMNGITAPPSVLSSKGKLEPREWVADKEGFDRALARLSEVKIRGGRLLLIRG